MSKKKLTFDELKALTLSNDAQLKANGGFVDYTSKISKFRPGQVSIIVDDLIDIRFQADRTKG